MPTCTQAIIHEVDNNICFNAAEILVSLVVGKEIGCGTFGNVYECYEENSPEKLLALKIFKPSVLGRMDLLIEAIETAQNLRHPCLLEIGDAFYTTNPDSLYLMMKYCPIGSINQIISSQKQIPEEYISKVLLDIISALEYMHKRNISHRDVKPDNILQDEDGRFVLIDYDVIRFVDGPSTKTNNVGTDNYIAPEIEYGHYDGKVDVYSLGMVIIDLMLANSSDAAWHQVKNRDFETFKSYVQVKENNTC
jgi:serine/threonine protein kinase